MTRALGETVPEASHQVVPMIQDTLIKTWNWEKETVYQAQFLSTKHSFARLVGRASFSYGFVGVLYVFWICFRLPVIGTACTFSTLPAFAHFYWCLDNQPEVSHFNVSNFSSFSFTVSAFCVFFWIWMAIPKLWRYCYIIHAILTFVFRLMILLEFIFVYGQDTFLSL